MPGAVPGLAFRSVRVSVPATSANLGPGFDALGLALDLRDELALEVTRAASSAPRWRIQTRTGLPTGDDNLVLRAVRAAFDALGVAPVDLTARYEHRIPLARGLGSSAAAISAGVTAALALAGDDEAAGGDLALQLATALEGHPDNVAACLLGGLTVAWLDGGARPAAVRVEPDPRISAVAVVPGQPVSTAASRGVLPADVPHRDAARTAGRAALLMVALGGRPEVLLDATEDWLHQPYRLPALPLTAAVVSAWRAAGVPGLLSGSGPTALALVVGEQQWALAEQVAHEVVQRVADVGGATAQVQQLALDRDGARVLGTGLESGRENRSGTTAKE